MDKKENSSCPKRLFAGIKILLCIKHLEKCLYMVNATITFIVFLDFVFSGIFPPISRASSREEDSLGCTCVDIPVLWAPDCPCFPPLLYAHSPFFTTALQTARSHIRHAGNSHDSDCLTSSHNCVKLELCSKSLHRSS